MDFVAKHFAFKPGERCIVIGEIGVNHNRDRDILFRLIDAGIESGVDIIKLQRFNSVLEIAAGAPATAYQSAAGFADQLKMAQALELPDDWLIEAHDYCRKHNIGFLCTAFERESVDFLADRLKCRSVKVPSPEITNRPLLKHMARRFDSLLVSTGASTLDEVARALDWIRAAKPGVDIALMHCTSQYPASVDQANLRAMQTMRDEFDLPVGYSDHTQGHVAAIAATALGAAMIEKHYTLDKAMPGPDHAASVDIPELKVLVRAVREVSSSLGDGIKKPAPEESETRPKIRKSLVCGVKELPAGTIVTADMIEAKRPWIEGAVAPQDIGSIIGRRLKTSKAFDEAFYERDFE